MRALLWGVGAALGGLGLYYLAQKPVRFLGDKADKGDLVGVPITAFGVGVPQVPAIAGQIVVRVDSTSPDVLVGPVVGWALAGAPLVGFSAIPATPSTVSVNRSAVTGILRGGKLLT